MSPVAPLPTLPAPGGTGGTGGTGGAGAPGTTTVIETLQTPFNMSVQEAQHRLMTLGYSVGPYGADGHIGGATSATRTALRRFQTNHHLPVTGNLDTATMQALGVA